MTTVSAAPPQRQTPAGVDDLSAPLRAFIARRVAPEHVDDVLQDALLRVHERGDQLRDAQRFSAWAYRIGRHAVADHHRRRAREVVVPDTEALDDTPAQTDAPAPAGGAACMGDERTFREALGVALTIAIDELPPPYAEALRLVELQAHTQASAAATLGIPPSSLRTRVQRGRALLRQRLQRACELHFDARDRLVGCTPRTQCCAEDWQASYSESAPRVPTARR